MPTVGFKEFELTSLPVEERAHVFHSSGTTEQRPSRHFHNLESLSIYEASLLPWFQAHLTLRLPGPQNARTHSASDKPKYLILTPPPDHAPNSSLVHMFETIRRDLGSFGSVFTGQVQNDGAWHLVLNETLNELHYSTELNRPVTLLGTAFSYVHLLDHLKESKLRFQLPAGSSALETGGYKGRSRTMPKAELHALITSLLGIPPNHIVCEYGMSEASSQAYDSVIGQPQTSWRIFRFPPWARAQIISPETGCEVREGETGLIRIFDLANVFSVMAIQTEDLGIKRGSGFELIGRSAVAEPRGCSLMST
jgi:hypothetical protein